MGTAAGKPALRMLQLHEIYGYMGAVEEVEDGVFEFDIFTCILKLIWKVCT